MDQCSDMHTQQLLKKDGLKRHCFQKTCSFQNPFCFSDGGKEDILHYTYTIELKGEDSFRSKGRKVCEDIKQLLLCPKWLQYSNTQLSGKNMEGKLSFSSSVVGYVNLARVIRLSQAQRNKVCLPETADIDYGECFLGLFLLVSDFGHWQGFLEAQEAGKKHYWQSFTSISQVYSSNTCFIHIMTQWTNKIIFNTGNQNQVLENTR